MIRPYAQLLSRVQPCSDRVEGMQRFVDVVWEAMHATGVSWIGFYLHEGDDELILGPRRDTPACSPIGMHGACGQAFNTQSPIVVNDVAELGAGYIACDPRDKSEVVIPVFNEGGVCWGVLDVDSHEVGSFDQDDVSGLTELLRHSGLTR